jgi:hypothetical protein
MKAGAYEADGSTVDQSRANPNSDDEQLGQVKITCFRKSDHEAPAARHHLVEHVPFARTVRLKLSQSLARNEDRPLRRMPVDCGQDAAAAGSRRVDQMREAGHGRRSSIDAAAVVAQRACGGVTGSLAACAFAWE